ncbi:MAG TPA: hypothetical protein VHS78_13680 [Candidatus Elarobacter sp.]|jgi:hypothetical protein|nr:hypothetical protein [Candidatus Elarobacter sp.]
MRIADYVLLTLLAASFVASLAGIVIGLFFGGVKQQFELGRQISRERHRRQINESR